MGQFSGGTRKIWKGGQNSIANLGGRSGWSLGGRGSVLGIVERKGLAAGGGSV